MCSLRSVACAAGAVAILAFAPCAARAQDPRAFQVAPPPSWVERVEPDLAFAPPVSAARDGVVELLSDRQVRVGGRSVARYHHRARRIVAAAGVSAASELRFDWDPPHQRLLLHHVRILRGGRAEDGLRPAEIRVIQQETELAQRVYQGTLTAVAFLRDVRVGDVIDFAFTIEGENPVLGERYSETFALGGDEPNHHLRVRLLTPSDRRVLDVPRAIVMRPEERLRGAVREQIWDRHDTPGLAREDRVPRWHAPLARVEITEHRGWADVVAWALPLYAAPTALAPEVAAQVEAIARAAPDDERRLLGALRFVQDEIRYLAISLGRGSHQPQPPADVIARRFGDCKGKTLLLVTLLRALGIRAHAALVNADVGRALDERSPSPLAFNHVIVRAELGGRTHWLDPTYRGQRGGLDVMESPDYERALVIAPDTRELAVIPTPVVTQPQIEQAEEITATVPGQPASLVITTTYRGSAADAAREDLGGVDRAELARRLLNRQALLEPSIVEAAPPVITDEPERGLFIIVESYRAPGFWEAEGKTYSARNIIGELATPIIARRSMPLAVRHPRLLVHERRITMPGLDPIDPGPLDIGDEAVSLHCERTVAAGAITARCRYQTKVDFVPAARVADHLRVVERMREALFYSTSLRQPRPAEPDEPWWLWAGILGLPVLGIALLLGGPKLLRIRWIMRKRAFSRKLALDAGEAPQTAITVDSRADAERLAQRARCPGCASRLDGAALDVSELALGERRITVVRATCGACRETRRLFFAVRG